MKTALITGITGQDGSYLAELLLSKGYAVHGIIRRASTFNTRRIDHIFDKLCLHYGDVGVAGNVDTLIHRIEPDEIYHLAAQSHVKVSFDQPEYTTDVTGLSTVRILESIRHMDKPAKFYQASSSELFGNAPPPQGIHTPFQPASPYAAAKLMAYWTVHIYRQSYGLFACNGILFNHESPRRGETFVTRKITRAVAAIRAGKQSELLLGNIDAQRDWGYAPEYVDAMWLMMQKEEPGDYIVGTGQAHSVSDFLDEAFGHAGLDWRRYVRTDDRYFRPTDVWYLCADIEHTREALGWEPKTTFGELVRLMVDAETIDG